MYAILFKLQKRVDITNFDKTLKAPIEYNNI